MSAEIKILRLATSREQREFHTAKRAILDVTGMVEITRASEWGRRWIERKLREALAAGETFEVLSRDDPPEVLATYRRATAEDLVLAAESGVRERSEEAAPRRRNGAKVYEIVSDAPVVKLTKQGLAILTVLRGTGRKYLSAEAIEILLDQNRDAVGVAPERDVAVMFREQFKKYFEPLGVVRCAEDEEEE